MWHSSGYSPFPSEFLLTRLFQKGDATPNRQTLKEGTPRRSKGSTSFSRSPNGTAPLPRPNPKPPTHALAFHQIVFSFGWNGRCGSLQSISNSSVWDLGQKHWTLLNFDFIYKTRGWRWSGMFQRLKDLRISIYEKKQCLPGRTHGPWRFPGVQSWGIFEATRMTLL